MQNPMARPANSQHSSNTGVPDPKALLDAAAALSTELSNCIQHFWGGNKTVNLFSIADVPHYFWHVQDFYVAQKGLDKEGKRWAQLRISEGLCQSLFESTLGKAEKEPSFNLSNLRGFEVYLLEQFSRKLFQVIAPHLIKKPDQNVPYSQNEPLMHLVWQISNDSELTSQIVLTLPVSCLKVAEIGTYSHQKWQLPDNIFFHAHCEVLLRLGSTKARLEDLQQLEMGDVVIFENSSTFAWLLWVPGAPHWVKIPIHVPDDIRRQDFLTAQGQDIMAHDMKTNTQTIWDNLEVDVTAGFQPVKLPLKQLKEIEQGLVLEVGSLMDNRVIVSVEGHPVAFGELLVLGDKFGVRIQGLQENLEGIMPTNAPDSSQMVLSNAQPQPQIEQYQQPQSQAQQQVVPQPIEPAPIDTLSDLQLDESDFDDIDDEEDWT